MLIFCNYFCLNYWLKSYDYDRLKIDYFVIIQENFFTWEVEWDNISTGIVTRLSLLIEILFIIIRILQDDMRTWIKHLNWILPAVIFTICIRHQPRRFSKRNKHFTIICKKIFFWNFFIKICFPKTDDWLTLFLDCIY